MPAPMTGAFIVTSCLGWVVSHRGARVLGGGLADVTALLAVLDAVAWGICPVLGLAAYAVISRRWKLAAAAVRAITT
jgi:hypothetical protein